jgi:iron complex transport system ATP-binding protein
MSGVYQLDNVGAQAGGKPILSGVTLRLEQAGLVAVLGPNGAGKSTLMTVLAGLRGYEGGCRFQGKEVRQWERRAFARQVSFVPQTVRVEFPFTCEQVILMGRTPHCAGMFETNEDLDVLARVMAQTETEGFRQRDFRTLSGGEKQRVLLASALAQTPGVLLLDEPAAFLDLKHQLALFALLRRLADEGMLVVAVTHDLNLAACYCQRALLMKDGRVMADGPADEALRPERIAEVFEVQAQMLPRDGKAWIAYG